MIVWINGAFGSGKTQTANELLRRMDRAFLYDPENVGYWLRKNEPKELAAENFQDEPLWRSINQDMLLHLSKHFGGTIIVPMTIISPNYYDEIIGELRRCGVDVRHFVLCARAETVRKRLRKRMESVNSWAARQLPACLSAFENPIFENRIQTDSMSIPETAEEIAARTGLALKPRLSPLRQSLAQLSTQFRAIRG